MPVEKDEKSGSWKESHIQKFRCHVIDWVLSLFVFFVGMLCYWRGIWDLYTHYYSLISPDEGVYNWYIFATGSGFILFYIIYPLANRLISGLPVLFRGALVRLLLYIGGVFAMGYWRGLWGLYDYYLEFKWQGAVIGLIISYSTLLVFNASRSVIFPPFVVSMDSRADALIPGTRFQTKLRLNCRSIILYFLDSLFTHFFILSVTILAWRSMLTLIGLIPSLGNLHDSICFGVGIFAVIILYILEIPFAILGHKLVSGVDWSPPEASSSVSQLDPSKATTSRNPISSYPSALEKIQGYFLSFTPVKMAKFKLHIYEDLVFLLIFTCEAFLWLGAWNLNATYIIADKQLGGWINHAFGSFILLCSGVMSFGGYCGCGRDDPGLVYLLEFFPNDPLYLYPIRYIRSIMEDRSDTSDSSSVPGTESMSESPIFVVSQPSASTHHTNLSPSSSSILDSPYGSANV